MNQDTMITVVDNGYGLMYSSTYFIGELIGDTFDVNGSYSCREEFQSYYLRDRRDKDSVMFVLSVHNLILSEYRRFIETLEKILNISGTIIVNPGQSHSNKNLVVLTVNSWWIKSKIRQEFLTIALRAYARWKLIQSPEDRAKEMDGILPIEDILKSEPYFEKTWDATKYFLAGNTLMKTGYSADEGWYNRFTENKITKGLNSWERSLVDEGYDERMRIAAEEKAKNAEENPQAVAV